MDERRRNSRSQLKAELKIERLKSQGGEKVTIQILDVSKRGVGFSCLERLEKGAVYEIVLTIWTGETIHAFIEIIRANEMENGIAYGAVFVGLMDTDAKRIEIYQTVEAYKSNQ